MNGHLLKPVTIIPLLCLLFLLRPCAAAEERNADKEGAAMITPAAQRAIDKALGWLAGRQNDDGSFGSGAYRANVGICGLSGMALMAGGSTPARGPYGQQVDRALDYVLANAQASGFICEPAATSHGPMYGHGFATTFLAECYGMSPRPDLREKLSKAVKLIINCQNKEGGWRYYPQRDDADISVTVCQVMALRAAHNAGIYVPTETIDHATKDYVLRCQNADGGFMYMLSAGGDSAFARSAAAVVALNSAGRYGGPEINKALDYLMQFRPAEGATRRGLEGYYEYGHYYAVQAMWQAGGDRWARWYPAIRDELISRQQEDGSWVSSFGPEYATAMSALVLQMPENQLPIFQR
ncbi:MAG: prenyltransferase/squalene oxidase repeat-containing protein [Thermoguttaceae bacterium]